MKKILSVFILSIAICIPLTSSAALMLTPPPVYTGDGPTSNSRTTQINQANLEAQQNAQKIAAEKALQEEQQKHGKIR